MKVILVFIISTVALQVSMALAKPIEDSTASSSEETDSSSEEELSSKEEACVNELHLDKQLITQLNNEQISPEDNDDFNKFMDCYWQKEEWIDSNGDVKYDKLLHSLMEEGEDEDEDPESTWNDELTHAIAYCKSYPTDGNTNGQTAVKVQNCILSKLYTTMDTSSDYSSEEELSSKEEACVDELHLDKQLITELNNEEVIPEDNDDFNKFIDCYWQKEEWLGSNGEVKYDNLLHSLTEEEEDEDFESTWNEDVTNAIVYCKSNPPTRGNTNGQTAVRIQNCITNKLYETNTAIDSSSEEKFSSEAKACLDELHIDKQLIIQLTNEQIPPEDNTDFNEFMDCYWQKQEWMDSNGEVKYDKLLHSLTGRVEDSVSTWIEEVANAVAYCETNPPTKGNTNGQTVVKIQNCITLKLDDLVKARLFSNEEAPILQPKEEDCIDELHLDKDEIMKLNYMEVVAEDNADFNKFLACYWMKEGWMDSNGEINYDKLLFSLRSTIPYQDETHVKAMMEVRFASATAFCQNNATKGDIDGETIAKLQNCITAKLNM